MLKTKLYIIIFFVTFVTICSKNSSIAKESIELNNKFQQEDFKGSGKYLAATFAKKIRQNHISYKMFLSVFAMNQHQIFLLQNSYKQALIANEMEHALAIAKTYISQGKISIFTALTLATDAIHNNNYKAAQAIIKPFVTSKNKNVLSGINAISLPFLYALSQAKQGMFDEANITMDNVQKKFPQNLSLLINFNKAIIYDLSSNNAKAKLEFDKIKSIDNLSYDVTRIIGNFYERNNNLKAAEEVYNNYNKRKFFETSNFVQEVNQLKNKNVSNKNLMKNYKYAISELFKEIAKILYNQRIEEESLIYLSLAMYLVPEDNESKLIKASYLENVQQYQKAIDIYKNIDKSSKRYWSSQLLIAENLYYLNKKKKSLQIIDNVYKKKPNNYSLLFGIAELLQLNKKYKKAEQLYTKIINDLSLSSSNNKNYWLLFFSRGISRERNNDFNGAEKDLKKALELKPNHPKILNYLGYTWIEHNINLKQALDMVMLAGKILPGDPQIIDSIGWGLYKLKLYDKSVLFLEKATEILPYDGTINYHLGNTYYKQKRFLEALYQWKKVLKYPSEDIDKKDIESKIKNIENNNF